MKITLTLNEAYSAIRSFHNLPLEAGVIIEGLVPAPVTAANAFPAEEVPTFSENVKLSLRFIDQNWVSNKIASIREYRKITGLGLNESKDSIEHWLEVRTFIAVTGKFGVYFNGKVRAIQP